MKGHFSPIVLWLRTLSMVPAYRFVATIQSVNEIQHLQFLASSVPKWRIGPEWNSTPKYNKQLLDEVFVISRIIKVEVGVISRSRRLRLITPTETWIILDVTKTESNNCFVIHWTKKMEVMFLLLHWRQVTQSRRTWHDYRWPWVSLTWLL